MSGPGRSIRPEPLSLLALTTSGPVSKHTTDDLVAELAALRPRPGEAVGYATRVALRELGRRAEFLADQIDRLDELLVPSGQRPGPEPAQDVRRRPQRRRHLAHRRR